MGVKLLAKIKIHEIAKKLDLTSKDIIERATKLGIDVKNHLSSVEEDIAKKIEESFGKKVNQTRKREEVMGEKKSKKESKETPVIIRREVIISEEEMAKREEEEKKKKIEEHNKQVGFVERNTNKDFNIVYRSKPTKP